MRRTTAGGLVLALAMAAKPAGAQTSGAATAEALFRQGKQLLEAKDYPRACPMLAESYRLDAATGALLALAACHEEQGKLASAWSEYAETAARSKREGRADRVSATKERMNAIEPRLSTLTITVSDSIASLPGFELRRDGVVLGRAVIGVSVPMDGGDHPVEITAAGKKPWKATVAIARERDKKTLNVASLDDASTPPAAPLGGAALGPAEDRREPATSPAQRAGTASSSATRVDSAAVGRETVPPPAPRRLTSMQIAGLAAGGAGVVGIAVGAVFGLSAMSKNSDANNGCSGSVCTTEPAFHARQDARSAGDISTIAFVAGGVLAAAGVTLYVVGGPKTEKVNLSIVPGPGPDPWKLSVQGVF